MSGMTTRERVIVFGTLALLVALNVPRLFEMTGSTPAHANPAPSSFSMWPVDDLTLSGADGDLLLRNVNGRVAWGDEPSDQARSLAFVSLGSIMQQLMARDEFETRRTELREELAAQDQTYVEQLQALDAQGRTLDPEQDGDQLQGLYEQWQAIQQQYNQWQQNAVARTGELETTFLRQSYEEMVEAVNVVAEKRSIDLVFQFTPADAPFEAENPGQAMSTIRMRMAMRYPKELDITDYVLEEMGLELE